MFTLAQSGVVNGSDTEWSRCADTAAHDGRHTHAEMRSSSDTVRVLAESGGGAARRAAYLNDKSPSGPGHNPRCSSMK